MADQFQPVCAIDLEEKSNLFTGKKFCVITGNGKFSKSDLEMKILENGGETVQNPGILKIILYYNSLLYIVLSVF